MIFIEGNTMDEIQEMVIRRLLEKGQRVKPRGMWIHELTAFGFRLNSPRSRLIYNPARKMNLMFAVGEWLWYLRGSNRCDIISYYNKRYPDFSDDGKTLHGAYGKRLFSDELTGFVQWEAVVRLLKKDPDTRQAVLTIHVPADLSVPSKDVPCTCYIQFLIRNRKLECIVNMRSNDIIWGTAYDVFSFTMLQEVMSRELGLEMGPYSHFAGSMHIYDRHLPMAEDILCTSAYESCEMAEMPTDPWPSLRKLLEIEESFRLHGVVDGTLQEPYWQHFVNILQAHSAWRRGDEQQLVSMMKTLPQSYAALLPKALVTN
ncbi:thymidylate synthase [Paenactinomyces guangxiensis]|uniref:thymidylate synthase n=1 Tax=Paenactinomyces guangxiensis TaxID=1490290 RepID=A0A7W1WND3_9BACL|nr:thymidylate synthase [Paenactinomyces guangxiensis]MBA4492986.1 thymidylate synthase [Paenactinomyces guangxiensis]MBH8590165.1 thymidylate synthase [Paenactinomyces guangxiensis]